MKFTQVSKKDPSLTDPDLPDHEFKCFFGENGSTWVAGLLYKRVLTDDVRDRLASFMTYTGSVGQRYQTYTETKRTRKNTLIWHEVVGTAETEKTKQRKAGGIYKPSLVCSPRFLF